MPIDTPGGHLYLGTYGDDDSPLFLEASDLNTHGVIVGMTGSGKTGLGIILLEEALLSGVPSLIIDPKGDMGNLLLGFPELLPSDFLPWIDASEAGGDSAQAAVDKAALWKSGLARSGIEPSRIKALHDKADFTLYTPGSRAGVALNLIGSLDAPDAHIDPETLQDEIDGFAASLLGLIGIDADPLSSREHILLTNIVHWSWSRGESLDLGKLIALVQRPPMRKLGVIDLDTFFPPADRVKLAMQLNGLAASPSFASWNEGEPLDLQSLLYGPDQSPRAAIVSIAHLADAERQFVVTLLLSRLVTWMRQQPGSTDLRVLVYMDEVFGYVPPVGAPPSKKPILTLLKQARAYGVGLVLSTQNPVDIDYKALSNAGTWMIGRLQTDRDKQRLLDGMGASDGSVDVAAVGDTISALDKREFVLHSTRASAPRTFATRWAMSYLAGPLTRQQIMALSQDSKGKSGAVSVSATVDTSGPEPTSAHDMTGADASGEVPPSATSMAPGQVSASAAVGMPLGDDESLVAPPVADGIPVRYLDPAASYLDDIGGSATGKRLQAGVALRVGLVFDETRAKLRHSSEWEGIITPLVGPLDPADAQVVDFDDRDLGKEPITGLPYRLPEAKIRNKTWFRSAQSAVRNHLYREERLELLVNPELKLFSRIDETREDFAARCQQVADTGADQDADKLRKTLVKKAERVSDAIERAEDKLREAEFDAVSRRRDQRSSQVIDIAGGILGSLLGGRRSTRSLITGTIRRSQSKGRMASKAEERLKSAENRYNELLEDRDALEQEIRDDLAAIQDEWSAKVDSIETLDVGLEKNDITVDDIVLVWIPVD